MTASVQTLNSEKLHNRLRSVSTFHKEYFFLSLSLSFRRIMTFFSFFFQHLLFFFFSTSVLSPLSLLGTSSSLHLVPSPSILSSGCLWFIHCLLLSTSHSFAATEDASTRALIHTLNILSVSGLQQQQQQQRHCSVCNKHTFYFLSVIIYISNTNISVQSCLKVFSSKKNDDGVVFEKYHWRWWILVCL